MTGTRRVLWMRHAKSSWAQGLPDPERPLNARGRRDAPRMARVLADDGCVPDLILCSEAERTLETAAWLQDVWQDAAALDVRSSLYHATSAELIAALRTTPPATHTVLVLAHNPGLEELVSTIAGVPTRMPTAAVARMTVDDGLGWSDIGAGRGLSLTDVLRPKQLAR